MIDARQRNTALLVAGCFFMENLDGTIVTTAAPEIGRSLGAPPTSVGLLVTVYLLTLAVLIPLSGWLTRRFGNRRVFLSAITIFTLASLGCAAGGNLGELLALRVLQGVGGAMMVPVGRLIVVARTEKRDLIRITSYIVWPGLLAPVIAPLAGGLITTYISWHWLFLMNIPLGIAAFGVAWRLIENTGTTAPPPLDRAGVLLTCTGLGGLTYTAHLVAETTASWTVAAAAGAVSLALLVAAVLHLLRTPHPLVSLRPLRTPTYRATETGGFLFWLVVGAAPFLLPLLFQTQFGWSPVKSGSVVLCVFAGNIAIKPATTPLIHRFGFKPLLIAATLGVAVTMAGLGLTTAGTPLPVIAVLSLLSGVARSVALSGYGTVSLSDIAPDQMRDATTLGATTQQLASGLAVAAATVALRLGERFGGLLPGAPSRTAAYTVAFGLLACVALGATLSALRLPSQAGDSLRRERPVTDPPGGGAGGSVAVTRGSLPGSGRRQPQSAPPDGRFDRP
ncbi:MFS transporter [Kitasatospora sp. NBC_01250]|uniref:MFS transporter n=1 Tax=Kitasatospora sp. NBC_01250 TaxID=2903571 RepID=UPI002E3135B0|nr:MFS transporter [Kitasatospora sp. NBC_01250]